MRPVRPVTALVGVVATCGVLVAVLPAQAEETPRGGATALAEREDDTVSKRRAGSPPTANDDSATVTQGGFVRVAVLNNDSDPESDPLSVVAIVSSPSLGVAEIRNNRIRYTAPASATGTDTLTYRISDGISCH